MNLLLSARINKRRRPALTAGVIGCVLLLAAGAGLLWHHRMLRLPFRDSFRNGTLDGWTAYGGNWDALDGGVRNDSEERGAKIIAGSDRWNNYAVEADVQLIGGGDTGLIARASDIERGVDSYSGYYVGLRTLDNKIVLGRAGHGWVEYPPKPFPGGIVPGIWYHLRLAVQGCTITATASGIDTPGSTEIRIEDPHCLTSGKIGLRSVNAGGMWRNVQVTPLSADAGPAAPTPHVSVYPTSQGSMRPSPDGGIQPRVSGQGTGRPTVSIRGLRMLSITKPAHVTVRGVVILTTPHLYIQDRGTGALVELKTPQVLRVGDEVEVDGEAHPEGISVRITDATALQIGGQSIVPPASVTADQAATGSCIGTFLEVQGILDSETQMMKSGLALRMHDGLQSFRIVSTTPVTETAFEKLEKQSTLRVRGVCVLGSEYTGNAVPFALLVSSPEDIKVIDGPPWWSTEHLLLLAAAMIALGFGVHLLFSRAEEWRLHAVINERERLANELHDTLAQSFAGIGFQLRAIRNRMAKKDKELDMPSLLEDLKIATELVRHSHDEARRSITTLRPEAIEAHGLVSALEMAARRIVARGQVSIDVRVHGEARQLPLHVLDSLFRIGQEALSNAIQHGHPSRIQIEVEYKTHSTALSIEDNGIGFVPRADSGGFGLSGMRRRAEQVRGTFEVQSLSGFGTRIRTEVPNPERPPWFLRLTYSKRKNQEHVPDV